MCACVDTYGMPCVHVVRVHVLFVHVHVMPCVHVVRVHVLFVHVHVVCVHVHVNVSSLLKYFE